MTPLLAVFLVLVGTGVFARLAVGPVTVGSVTFDIQTMIAAASAGGSITQPCHASVGTSGRASTSKTSMVSRPP